MRAHHVLHHTGVGRIVALVALLGAAFAPALAAADTPDPTTVTIAGSLQSELGCPGDWQPECTSTQLAYDGDDDVWQGSFTIPAGSWEYKAALNQSWDENYGANAVPGGPNIGLNLLEETTVKLYYSHRSHWVTDNVTSTIATLAGSFQSELGCPGDWQPDCLRTWLEDPDGDGIYTFTTDQIPVGAYEVKVAHNESWDLNYGAGGVQNGPNIGFSVAQAQTELELAYDATSHVLSISTTIAGDLNLARAHWVDRSTIAWAPQDAQDAAVITLHYAPEGGMTLTATGVAGGQTLTLEHDPAGLPTEVLERYPHLAGLEAYVLSGSDLALVPEILKGQIAVSAADATGKLLDATSIQIPGVLDDLFSYDGPLGVSFEDGSGSPTIRLWAPTAISVTLHLFDDADPASPASVYSMTNDPGDGVWSLTGSPDWYGKYYEYEVMVWVRSTGQIESNLVTDPYSVSLSANSRRSQIVDLEDPALMPDGWSSLAKPALDAPEDVAIYELHVRDFSWYDETVPEALRGTFLAFTVDGSNGLNHLEALADAGLTHIHLLPSFDIATIEEHRGLHEEPEGDLASYPADSQMQQAAVTAVADTDGFNWGYDPFHYTVPEGSYSTDPDGATRTLELRDLVQSLNQRGLRVVMDVVYNHTNDAGQGSRSVLDRIVPGYYHRLSQDGFVETSTCCPNTATEHDMMEKLMIDSIITWAREYKIDGFRFDLMGHHMLVNMAKVRQALDQLTLTEDGVDGSKIYIYGEGWDFGEVAGGARGTNATQLNMAGTGIGTFNDRIRDGIRGGGPFSGLQEQGFVTGLWYDPNGTDQGTPSEQEALLKAEADWIRCGLAGNLADYPLTDSSGNEVTASQVDYKGAPAGYTQDPQEDINYAAAHDNETLFDAIQLKLPRGTSMADRVRVQNLALSLVGLGQGIPFFHAGMDMLRSKSMDRDSYNSGDWFNRLDFSYQTNTWGVGLPVASKNESSWPLMQPLLADETLRPGSENILSSVHHLQEILRIRSSTRLLRMRTKEDVINRLEMLNTGPDQIPGLIAMRISDPAGAVDRRTSMVVVLFNATVDQLAFQVPDLVGRSLALHPVLVSSADPIVATSAFDSSTGTFTVPARTTAVFITARTIEEQTLLLSADITALIATGHISPVAGSVLLKTIRGVIILLRAGRPDLAAGALGVFTHLVQTLVDVDLLSQADGTVLIAHAGDIIQQLV